MNFALLKFVLLNSLNVREKLHIAHTNLLLKRTLETLLELGQPNCGRRLVDELFLVQSFEIAGVREEENSIVKGEHTPRFFYNGVAKLTELRVGQSLLLVVPRE